jgi:predicted dehydrogenase
MAKTWRIALIGAGTMGRKHLAHFKHVSGCEIAAVSSAVETEARSAAGEFGIPVATTDNRRIFGDPTIDAVVIASPPDTHHDLLIASLKSGKHVLLEKPAAITRGHAKAMLREAARHRDLIVLVANCRHSILQPKFRFVRRLIAEGRLGTVYHIRHSYVCRRARPGADSNTGASWFLDRSKAGGGPSFDWGVYDLAFHLGLLDEQPRLEKISAFMRGNLDRTVTGKVFDVEEHFGAFMEFEGGLTYSWERASNAHNESPNVTRIYGTKAGLKFSYFSWEKPEVILYDTEDDGRGKERSTVLEIPMEGHNDDNIPLLRHFIDCLEGRSEPFMPLRRAVDQLEILLRIREASE